MNAALNAEPAVLALTECLTNKSNDARLRQTAVVELRFFGRAFAVVKYLGGMLVCILLSRACMSSGQQADTATLPKSAGVCISFLNEASALNSTMEFLKKHGCSGDGLLAFVRAVNYYNLLPFEVDRGKFPEAKNGFYSFQSMSQLIAALPSRLCEAPHPFEVNCYDTVIFLADGQLRSGLGPDDVFGWSAAPRIETNWTVTLSSVATAGDAYSWSCPPWYQELTRGFIPAGSLKSRTNLFVALFSFSPLPGHIPQESVPQKALETLRYNWKCQGILFPRNCEVVLCHKVRLDPPSMLTVHAGLLFTGATSLMYIEKDGGFGPFVRLDFKSKADLLKWLSQEEYLSPGPEKEMDMRTFVTFNQDDIEELFRRN
ncbi:MAG TPA: hypothetical protein VG167_13965 [Verrucomicrobiae bacterium]|nr:hypothetical protein [Verrucomicrobiae bacterium]